MKCALGEKQTGAPREGASKFDGGFHAFAAGAGEMRFLQASPGAFAKTPGEFARQFGHIALKHHRPAPVQFVFKCSR